MKIYFQSKIKSATLIIVLTVVLIFSGFLLYIQNHIDGPPIPTKIIYNPPSPTPSPTPTLKPLPNSKTLSGGYQTYQTFNNCGPASLSMGLSYFGINKTQPELGNLLRPYQIPGGNNDDKSVTFAEMANLARSYGLIPYHRPTGNFEIIKNFINYGIPVIVRTWTKPTEDIGHYRVIKGFDSITNEIIQDDSLQGKNLRYTENAFSLLWEKFNYEFLVLAPPDKQHIAENILGDFLDTESARQKAIKISEGQLAQNPDDIYARFNLSVAYYYIGEYGKSALEFESVQNKLPFRTLWYQIEPILAYQKLGRFDAALVLIDKVINNSNRAFAEGYKIKSEIYESQGNIVASQQELEKVYYYNKNFYKYWE